VLGKGEIRRRTRPKLQTETAQYTGWELPLLPADLSAVIEKEVRYALRNVQLRTMALMPLILIVIRFMNSSRTNRSKRLPPGMSLHDGGLLSYAQPLLVTAGILYVYMILAGVACNEFAFEEGGMRTLILAPVERRRILIGKNLVVTLLASVFSAVLLILNEIAFRDLNLGTFLFVALSFIVFAVIMSLAGNWFSIQFPKRMKFGKRLNVSGMAGLLILVVLIVMALPSLAAVFAGYFAQSLAVEYVTLALFAGLALVLYFPIVTLQGRSLERREREVLEVVAKEVDV